MKRTTSGWQTKGRGVGSDAPRLVGRCAYRRGMMEGFWLTFTDGSKGYCQGVNAYDAVRIAEHLTGKTAVVGDNKYRPDVKRLPYPADRKSTRLNSSH